MYLISQADNWSAGWGVVIGAVGIIVVQVATLVIGYLREKDKIAREDALAAKVQEVKEQAETAAKLLKENTRVSSEALVSIAAVGEKTHSLVNSAMLEQQRIYSVKCDAAAKDNPSASNVAEANAAADMYLAHKVKQEAMDVTAKEK